MAYGAVISLMHIIHRLLNSSDFSLFRPSRKIIKSANKHVQSLEQVLKLSDSTASRNSERVKALDGEIREAVHKFEDILESHISNQVLIAQSDEDQSRPLKLSLDLEEMKQEIHSFVETVQKMEEYIYELSNHGDDDVSRAGFVGKMSKMVGFSDKFLDIRSWILDPVSYFKWGALVGLAGIGKTTLSVEIFEDQLIMNHFDCRAFVTVGQKWQLKRILHGILAQVNPSIHEMLNVELDDLKRMMHKNFKGRKYLIVLDDVWEKQVCDDLGRLFPNNNNGSRVMLTTRVQRVADYMYDNSFKMGFLNKEESSHLLQRSVFGEALCPQLEKVGKEIAENCEGLPLLIVTVADLLSKTADKTLKHWKEAAAKESSIFMDANDRILKVLFSSYEYLPQHLKSCFLYMGVFPKNYEIPRSKLFRLWSAEGFLVENFSMECCLDELVSKSLVMVRKKSSSMPAYRPSFQKIKTCSLHPVFWHLCNREAERNKFSHILDSYVGRRLAENERRLSVHKSVLFGFKDVCKSIATTRSILFTAPPHQYPVPICFDHMRLLRVLDALTIRLYEFPTEVVKLVQLRYLALTCNGINLPASISNLRNLQCLIVLQHLNIVKLNEDESYLPMEIWDMKELQHLQITGSNLPDPRGAILSNLTTLLDVSPRSCTKEILERIPKLGKLGIRFDLMPNAAESLNLSDLIFHICVNTIKCVTMNPIPMPMAVVPPSSFFYSSIRKLSLSGFGYPWEYMSVIATLWSLQVLKLRCYAFRGPKWETQHKGFRSLKFLLIEDSDLVDWTVGYKTFRDLEQLTMRRCHKLEGIPWDFGESIRLSIELVDCNPLVVTCAKQMQEDRLSNGRSFPKVNVHSSWDDGNL